MAAEAVLKMSCAEAHKSLPRLGGCPLSAAGLHREALRQGAHAPAIRQADVNLTTTIPGVAQLARQAKTPSRPVGLILQMDAWNIRERAGWGESAALRQQGQEPARWHWGSRKGVVGGGAFWFAGSVIHSPLPPGAADVAPPTLVRREATRLSELSPQQWRGGLAAWLGWLFDGLDMHLYTLVAAPFVMELTRS